MSRITLQPAYLLHTRAFRETSVLGEWFTRDHGRISGVVRGVKRSTSRWRGILQTFAPLMISWVGKGDWHTVTEIEPHGVSVRLSGEGLLCGFYLNELIIKLLHYHDPHPGLFELYRNTMSQLVECARSKIRLQALLRIFEKRLLAELGYALILDRTLSRDQPIEPERYYHYTPAQGFVFSEDSAPVAFQGKNLLALQAEELTSFEVLRDAKRLLRMALESLLEKKPIHSRELFLWREVQNEK